MKKAILIQARNFQGAADHEYFCFENALAAADVFLERINSLDHPVHPNDLLKKYDAVLMGGSHLSSADNFPHKRELNYFIKEIIKRKIPFFGACFGFEMLIENAGGTIIHDKKNEEYGTFDVRLTEKGERDNVFKGFKETFSVQAGHEWRAGEIPDHIEILASNENAFCQAAKIKDLPVYGVQFHPELDDEQIAERFRIYNQSDFSKLSFTQEDFDRIKPSPRVERILENFAKHVI